MSIDKIDKLRIEARNSYIAGIVLSIFVAIILFLMFNTLVAAFFPFFLGLVITVIISEKKRKSFSTAFKETFVKKSLESIFTDFNYNPDIGLDSSIISMTGMMYMGDRYSSNDLITGKYKNINIMQSDVHIEEEQESVDSDGNTETYWITIFKGRWMVFDFNKNFKANVQVCEKGFSNSKLDSFSYKKVQMEDQEFNKIFNIYAIDEHEAFYILTPHLMEKIKKLESTINGKILFCFVNNKLHIGLYNNVDSFEHSVFSKIDENKVISEISKDIKIITDFVDELNLDNDLFRKEV